MASTISGTKRLGSKEVYKLPGPNNINSAFSIASIALANAGVYLGDVSLESLSDPIPLGVMTGLLFGKQIGVFFTTFLLIKFGYARLPSGSNWMQMFGVAVLTGIGFTMAMFINFLAFDSDVYINQAKIGILIASFISAV